MMHNTQESSTHTPTETDRRGFQRYAAEDIELEIQNGASVIHGHLSDQSIGGIAVLASSVADLAFGQEVTVHFMGEMATGYVRSIRREDDDLFRLSISWDDYASVDGERRRSIAHFVSYRNDLFVCELLFDDKSQQKMVRLWDGAEFRVSPEELCSRSIDTRRSELMTDGVELQTLARLYGIESSEHEDDLIQLILDFEFSFARFTKEEPRPSE